MNFDLLSHDEIEKAAHMQIEAFARLIHSIQSVHLSSDDSAEIMPKSNASVEKPPLLTEQQPGNLQKPKRAT